jgi:tRNA dimethylallyltransferase
MKNNKLVVIVGPTASGKTSLAIDLAKKYNGEIICADSRTVYKGMDIGTAKPSKVEQEGIKHYLLDILEPGQKFSAADFKRTCSEAVEKIRNRGKLPIIVGGSGLYIDAYLYDYKFRDNKTDMIDTKDMTESEIISLAKEAYPDETKRLDVNNLLRMKQLMERGPVNNEDRNSIKIECKIIGLNPEKLILKQNIAKRTNQMLNKGFVQEVESLRAKYGKDCPSLQTIGYRQVNDMLNGDLIANDVENTINSATRDLAKRQLTWFKRNKSIDWTEDASSALKIAKEYMESI